MLFVNLLPSFRKLHNSSFVEGLVLYQRKTEQDTDLRYHLNLDYLKVAKQIEIWRRRITWAWWMHGSHPSSNNFSQAIKLDCVLTLSWLILFKLPNYWQYSFELIVYFICRNSKNKTPLQFQHTLMNICFVCQPSRRDHDFLRTRLL